VSVSCIPGEVVAGSVNDNALFGGKGSASAKRESQTGDLQSSPPFNHGMWSRELCSIRNWIREKVLEGVLEIGSRFRTLRGEEDLQSVPIPDGSPVAPDG
jgi:hypothetical protein